jgi:hypothetical protein
MSQNVTFNGQVYVIPDLADNNWGQNVTDYLVALPQGALQKTAGAFTLAADVDFGASYGLKSAYYSTRAANPASAGLVRLANTDTVVWRNAGNSGDLALAVNGSNQLTFNGVILESDTLPSAYIFVGNASNESTGVPMTGDIGIDNTGLTAIQNGVIINTDINASAAIAMSKLATLATRRMVVTDASGFIAASGWDYDINNNLVTGFEDEIRFQDSAGGDYVGFRAPTSVTTHTYLLPIAAGLNGQVLSWTTGGQLAWINASGTGTINSGTAGRFAYYAVTGTTLSDQSLLTTDGTNITLASGHFLTPDGTALLPSYSFSGDPDTGIYLGGVNAVAFTAGGSYRAIIDTRLKLKIVGAASNTPIFGILDNGGSEVWTFNYTDSDGRLAIVPSSGAYPLQLNSNQILHQDGTVGAPSLSFISDVDTGIYRSADNVFNLVTGGTSRLYISNGSVRVQNAPLYNTDGSAAGPSYSFESDTNTGFYSTGADEMAITVGGGMKWRFYSNNQMTSNGNGTASAPVYSFENYPTMGMYASTVPDIRWAVGGALKMYLDATALQMNVPIGASNGSASAPSLSFASDPDTGIFSGVANQILFATNGTNRMTLSTTDLDIKIPLRATGTTTNDNASAGYIGEYVSSAVTAVNAGGTGVWGDATSISLTAGDWDVCGFCNWDINGATWSDARLGISTTSGNSGTGLSSTINYAIGSWASTSTTFQTVPLSIPSYRISLSSTTTIYLKYYSTYSSGTPRLSGASIHARRVR